VSLAISAPQPAHTDMTTDRSCN